jgi:predicted alpha/beta-hydrolase family hydrolase
MWTTKKWNILGYRQNSIPNDFYEKIDCNSHLAIILPGYGYSTEGPLIQYAMQLLFEIGYDVLAINYRYNENDAFQKCTEPERKNWITEDVLGVCSIALNQPQYKDWVILGKSLGTDGMLKIIENSRHLDSIKLVWLTPGSSHSNICNYLETHEIPSLLLAGTTDSFYNEAEYRSLEGKWYIQIEVYKGADHSLEITNDVRSSIEILTKYLEKVRLFVQDHAF